MSLLDRIFRITKPTPLPSGSVTVELTGPMLKSDGKLTSETEEFSALQDRVIAAMEEANVGLFDCNEVEDNSAKLFLYGSDPERLFAEIEPVLRASSLGAHARIVMRSGEPGSSERVVQL